ncbi:MAG TPA: hypothetical protein VFQ35_23755 [Polyangiaceae bacterium]|nr:hypothetical protein [Polyangiaceae bacterium]
MTTKTPSRATHRERRLGPLALAFALACATSGCSSETALFTASSLGGGTSFGGALASGGFSSIGGAVSEGGTGAGGTATSPAPDNRGGSDSLANGGHNDGGRTTAGAKNEGGAASSDSGGSSASQGGASAGVNSGGSSASAGAAGKGSCCSDGDCLCHGPAPTALTSKNGPYGTASLRLQTGTLHYPTDAEPPLAGIAICPGFLNTGPEMGPWGPFYASWGIAVIVTDTTGADLPNVRGDKLVAAIEELKAQNMASGPLAGKLAGRYGTSGYSMGGGGTTFASAKDPTYRTSIGLAAWGPDGTNVKVPTLFLCSDTDTVAGCGYSQTAYDAMGSTSKMLIKVPNATHFNWFDPTDAGQGMSGEYALAFQKVFLEGDQRWRPLLLAKPAQGSGATNIQ